MQTSLRGIAKKAEKFKQHRFENLYRTLNFHALKIAWYEINKQAAKGTDKISAQDFAKNLDSNLVNLVNRLKGKRYKTNLVRRVEIAKDNGKKRALGIPALADKLVQRAVAKILEAIYEREFLSCSHGYRPKKSPHTAIKQLSKELQVNKYSYIVEADIKGFFDNIDHQWMTKMLEQRIKDKAILNLINKGSSQGYLFPKLNLKLRGYYNFYGITGNLRSLYEFYDKAKSILYKWLNRRSQRRSFNWKEFHRVLDIYGIMKPKITESNIKQQEFEYI